MTKVFFCAILLIVYVLFQSCTAAQKINTLKPEADHAEQLVYENAISTIAMPVSIKLRDIENQINKSLSGLIYEDSNIEDDNYTIKVWKQARITLTNIDGKIQTVLPLKALINYRIGTSQLGLNLYSTRELNLNGIVTLGSVMQLYNWKLTTKTDFKSLDWNESPTVTILGKNMPITYIIAPALKLFKSKIERNIDEAIGKASDFKPNVLAAIEKICLPIQINEEYNTWLRINPISITSTAAVLRDQSIEMQLGIKSKIETLIGSKPISTFNSAEMTISPVKTITNLIEANILAISTYEDASLIMNNNFKNKNFGEGSRKVTVQNVAIWHKTGKMVIALDLTGSLNGTIYLVGVPIYNPTTKEIYFDDLDYAVDTKSKLLRTASWLASNTILKKLKQSCKYSIQSNLEQGKQSMLTYLTNYAPMAGVFINGTITEIDFQKIQLSNKAIIAFLKVNGSVKITVDGLQ